MSAISSHSSPQTASADDPRFKISKPRDIDLRNRAKIVCTVACSIIATLVNLILLPVHTALGVSALEAVIFFLCFRGSAPLTRGSYRSSPVPVRIFTQTPVIDPRAFSARIPQPAPVVARDFRPRETVGDGHINPPPARPAPFALPTRAVPTGIDSRPREAVGDGHINQAAHPLRMPAPAPVPPSFQIDPRTREPVGKRSAPAVSGERAVHQEPIGVTNQPEREPVGKRL